MVGLRVLFELTLHENSPLLTSVNACSEICLVTFALTSQTLKAAWSLNVLNDPYMYINGTEINVLSEETSARTFKGCFTFTAPLNDQQWCAFKEPVNIFLKTDIYRFKPLT